MVGRWFHASRAIFELASRFGSNGFPRLLYENEAFNILILHLIFFN